MPSRIFSGIPGLHDYIGANKTSFPSSNNQNCLCTLWNVTCEAKTPPIDKHGPIVTEASVHHCVQWEEVVEGLRSTQTLMQWQISWHFDIYKTPNVTPNTLVLSTGDEVTHATNTTLVCHLYSWLRKMLTDSQRAVTVKIQLHTPPPQPVKVHGLWLLFTELLWRSMNLMVGNSPLVEAYQEERRLNQPLGNQF